MKLNGTEKILFMTSAGIGDFTKDLGILNAVKEAYPGVTIDVLVLHEAIRELAAFNTNINEVIIINFSAFTVKNYLQYFFYAGIKDLVPLNRRKYDLVLCPNLNPLRAYLAFFMLKPKKIILHDRQHDIRTEYAVLQKIGISDNSRAPFLNNTALIEAIRPSRNILDSASNNRLVLLNMFCADSPQCIRDFNKWGDLVEKLKIKKYTPVLIGKADFDYRKFYPLDYGAVIDLVNQTGSLHDLIFLTKKAYAIIAVDSFIFHLAYALEKKVIGLFGPVDPVKRIPPGLRIAPRSIFKNVECAPCMLTQQHKTSCKKNMMPPLCMDAITVEDIMDLL